MTGESAFDELVSGLNNSMFIVTTRAGDTTAGCLVGFASQASIDPPRLIVMLSKKNYTYNVARRADVLVVHFLGADNAELATLFGEETGDVTDKFSRCESRTGPSGVPVISGTRGWVAGRVVERLDAGDHVAHLLETIDAATDSAAEPMRFDAVKDMEPGHDA